MTAAADLQIDSSFVTVRERLCALFTNVDPHVIDDTIRRCADEFVDARIRTFVPVFVERMSTDYLKTATSTATDVDLRDA